MTNITLSIDDRIHKKMKKFSEIKWSEFIRKCVEQRIKELESISNKDNESILNMLASEESLKKDWDNDLDKRWDYV